MTLACLLVGGIGLAVFILLVLYFGSTGGRRPTGHSTPGHRARPNGAQHGFDPYTGEWRDRDGTPYGAIDDLFTDADGDGA
jgi:hypothetical protein